MWRQSCSCNSDARVRQILIGDVIVGIIGIDEALKQLDSLGRPPGPEAADELLAIIGTRNYVAYGQEGEYKAALLREYAAFWKKRHGAGQGEEKQVRR